MSVEYQPDASGKYRQVMTIPASLTLSQSERGVIESNMLALKPLLEMTPLNSADAEGGMLAVLTKMMMVLPGQKASEMGVEATGEAYMDSLDDVPTWAVSEAIRVWNKGQSQILDPKQPHDFRWRPAPAILRALAQIEAAKVYRRIADFELLLSAEPLIEYSDEHRKRMVGAVRELLSPSPIS